MWLKHCSVWHKYIVWTDFRVCCGKWYIQLPRCYKRLKWSWNRRPTLNWGRVVKQYFRVCSISLIIFGLIRPRKKRIGREICFIFPSYVCSGWCQWPRNLKRRSAAERLLGPWVWIPPGAWMSVCCECLYCQVEVSATGRSLVQRSPTDCGVCVLSVIKRK
jgi:hypothetical protein